MANKTTGILMTTIATILAFCSVAYMSCSKKDGFNPKSCINILCENGGFCDSGKCVCPAGYEGANCATASIAKYIGNWDVAQKVIGSSNLSAVGNQSSYVMNLTMTASPTSFFFNNFYNNPNYNKIGCVIDTTSSSTFTIDTSTSNQNFHMAADGILLYGGKGSISTDDSGITAQCYIRKSGGEDDTLMLTLTPHHL